MWDPTVRSISSVRTIWSTFLSRSTEKGRETKPLTFTTNMTKKKGDLITMYTWVNKRVVVWGVGLTLVQGVDGEGRTKLFVPKDVVNSHYVTDGNIAVDSKCLRMFLFWIRSDTRFRYLPPRDEVHRRETPGSVASPAREIITITDPVSRRIRLVSITSIFQGTTVG